MSHQINFNPLKNTYSFASNSEVAWHGLGQVVKEAMTADQVMKLANLDYEVEKTSVHAFIKDAYEPNVFKEKYATYRTDTGQILGMVGSRYEIVQNAHAFEFFDSIIDKGEAIFETAGALGEGQRIFVTAKLPEDILVKGEKLNEYIILTNSHDGTSSIIAGFTSVRVVCNNTLQAALQGLKNKIKIPHTTGAKEKLHIAYELMGLSSSYMKEVNIHFNEMAEKKISEDALREFIFEAFKPQNIETIVGDKKEQYSKILSNRVDATVEFCKTHPTQLTPSTNGTVFGAYNGVSGYFNYIQKYKTPQDRFNSQLFGIGEKIITKAFKQAVELI